MAGKDAPELALEREELDSRTCVIAAHGQIDLYSAPAFKESVVEAIDGGATELIIDLSDVDFMDSTGLGVLVGAYKRLKPLGGSIAVVSGDDLVRRIFEVSGLQDLFPIHDSRAALSRG